jgi:hypothetical protein
MPARQRCLLLDPWDEGWKALVETDSRANIFHHPAWIYLLAECYGYRPFVVAVGDESGRVGAGLPFMEVTSPLTGRRWVSLPFTDYCRPLYRDCASLDQLACELPALIKTSGAPRIEVRWDLSANAPAQTDTSYVFHTLKLEANAANVLERFHRTQRQNVKRAAKDGLRVKRGVGLEHVRLYYDLHCATRRRQGVPAQPWRFFELLARNVLAKGLGFVLLSYANDKCSAAGLFLAWQRTLTYKYSASSDAGQDTRANHLLTWTAMQWGCEHGYTEFDFGRTDVGNEGLRTFKKRWGATEAPLTYSTFSATPRRLKASRIASIFQPAIRAAPVWVCRAVGELCYRHFG